MTFGLNDLFQIQLEKIRQAENEVRWQHEDDIEDCTNCKQAFSVTKRKVRSSGKLDRGSVRIFCTEWFSLMKHSNRISVYWYLSLLFQHHCRHCGKIFCSDCISKTVISGPNSRQFRVCDICHTILVKDAMPYFSTEPPSTPD